MQPAWPHADDRHSVNIWAILLIFVALDSPFHEVQKIAAVCFILMDGYLAARVPLHVGR